jgi:predicted AAA+ superfamily ATPase
LREDLEVSHKAVSHWIEILERLYHIFIIRPFESRAIKSLKKMPKAYLWDASLIPDEGARFENVVALHLLKLCHYLEDSEGYRVELWYLRDTSGREIDFLVTYDHRPWFAVEAKLSEEPISKALLYLHEHLKIPYLYQVHYRGSRDFEKDSIRCLSASKFLAALI